MGTSREVGGRKPPRKPPSRLSGSGERNKERDGWQDLEAIAWDNLAWLIDEGIGAFLGRTGDGGRLTLTLIDGDDKVRHYESSQGMGEVLQELRDRLDTERKES